MNNTDCSPMLGKMRCAKRTAAAAIDTESRRCRWWYALLGDRKSALKQLVQERAERAGGSAVFTACFILAPELRLAQHHRIKRLATRRRVFTAAVAEGVENREKSPRPVNGGIQTASRLLLRFRGVAVNLGAVAGGKNRLFLHAA